MKRIQTMENIPAKIRKVDPGIESSDPADYLFSQTKFHDCHLTVGIPGTNDIEKIPVVTSHLVAHSTVFREMLLDSNLADRTGENTHITDILPEIFKLMLTFIYRGRLPELKTLCRKKAMHLAICADKYNIPELVRKICKRLLPTDVKDVFTPLHLMVYVECPLLLVTRVTEIIQQKTADVLEDKQFLALDDNCLEFIAKQDVLSITELGLWQHLVRWASHNTRKSKVSKRALLKKPLLHVRLATLSVENIIREVKPTNILEAHEVLEIITSIVENKRLEINGLCSSMEFRKSPFDYESVYETDYESSISDLESVTYSDH